MAYLNGLQTTERLSRRFSLDRVISDGDAEIASQELESLGPFIGTKLVTDGTQDLSFPRSVNPDGSTNDSTTAPDAVLDWVALAAYELAASDLEYSPALTSRSARGISESFAAPSVSQTGRRMATLLRPYLLKVGQRVDTRPYSLTPERDAAS